MTSLRRVTIRTTKTDASPMQSLTAYIVEDSPVIRDSLIATLEELVSVKVVGTAEDETSAVQWMLQSQQPVDLMIIDIFLKSGSGLGVLRAASALPNSVKRVVLSNYATVDMRRKCLALGADRVRQGTGRTQHPQAGAGLQENVDDHQVDGLPVRCHTRSSGWCLATTPRWTCVGSAWPWVPTGCSTNHTTSTH